MNKNALTKNQKIKQRIAIVIMFVVVLPILVFYFSFFKMAFFDKNGVFTLENFQFLYSDMKLKQTIITPITLAARNSIIFTVIVTFFEVAISLLAGYAISRMNFTGKGVLQYALLGLRMFPNLLLLIAVLYVLITLKIVNTMLGVVLVAIAFRVPGSTFIIRNFFNAVPKDIENSALVDGCNRFSAFFQVIIHLVKPGIASIAVFSFMSAWSNYILFNTLIFDSKTPVIATYIRALSRSEQMIAPYSVFSAMAIVYMIPVLIFFIISQKQLMQGDIGGGKGV